MAGKIAVHVATREEILTALKVERKDAETVDLHKNPKFLPPRKDLRKPRLVEDPDLKADLEVS
jgi:hypothetical protein